MINIHEFTISQKLFTQPQKRRHGTRQVRGRGTGIPDNRNKASPYLYGMSIAQFP